MGVCGVGSVGPPVISTRNWVMGRREKGEDHSTVTSRSLGETARVGVPGGPVYRKQDNIHTLCVVGKVHGFILLLCESFLL